MVSSPKSCRVDPPATEPPASSSPPSLPPIASSSLSQRASSSSPSTRWDAITDEVWGHAFCILPADADHGPVAAVCRRWFHAEHGSRSRIAVRDFYATTPFSVVQQFPSVRAAEVRGKPHWADFRVLPANWRTDAAHWVKDAAHAWPHLEEIRFKRMVASDDRLRMIAACFDKL